MPIEHAVQSRGAAAGALVADHGAGAESITADNGRIARKGSFRSVETGAEQSLEALDRFGFAAVAPALHRRHGWSMEEPDFVIDLRQ